jgi:hypothetical protein
MPKARDRGGRASINDETKEINGQSPAGAIAAARGCGE